MDASQYWRTGFRSLLHAKQLVEYIVLDIEAEPGVSSRVGQYSLAEVQVARKVRFWEERYYFYGTHTSGSPLERWRLCLGL
jgi:hypothetical protein